MNEKEKLQGKRAGFSPEDTGIEAKADRKEIEHEYFIIMGKSVCAGA
mgnify:FL=1